MQEYFTHTMEGKLKLVDIMKVIQAQKAEQLKVRRFKPNKPKRKRVARVNTPVIDPALPQAAHAIGVPVIAAVVPVVETMDVENDGEESASNDPEESSGDNSDDDQNEIVQEDRSTRSLSTQLDRIATNAAELVLSRGEKKKVNKNCVSVPSELSKVCLFLLCLFSSFSFHSLVIVFVVHC